MTLIGRKKNAQYFNHITMKGFKAWIKERRIRGVPDEDQVISIYDKNGFIPSESTNDIHCFSGYTRPASSLTQIYSWNNNIRRPQEREELVIDVLQNGVSLDVPKTKNNRDIEVLHLKLYKS
jgi:hypothetical protein